MLLAYCFVSLTSGLISLIGLWPILGLMSFAAAPLIASATTLAFAAILSDRVKPLKETAALEKHLRTMTGLLEKERRVARDGTSEAGHQAA